MKSAAPEAGLTSTADAGEESAVDQAQGGAPADGLALRPILLTREGAAAVLSVSPATIDAWRIDGTMPPPCISLPRLVRWSLRELEEWVAAGCPPVKTGRRSPSISQTPVAAAEEEGARRARRRGG